MLDHTVSSPLTCEEVEALNENDMSLDMGGLQKDLQNLPTAGNCLNLGCPLTRRAMDSRSARAAST